MLNIYLWLSTATGIPMHTSSVGVLRDIDAIWKPHLTHTAWDKWEKNLCHSCSPCKELFLKIVVCFGFVSLMHQSTDASFLSERRRRHRWSLTVARRENRSPSASSPHPDLQMGWTQPKEAAALRPPTDWQLHVGIPMTARKELAAILPPRAPSLRGTIYTSPSKTWIPRYFIQPNDN